MKTTKIKIGIFNSGGCNINSIKFALERLGILESNISLITNRKQIEVVDKLILPGVGHATTAMDLIYKQDLIESIRSTTKSVLGICLGMQIMCESSTESHDGGKVQCLNIFKGSSIIKLPPKTNIPQMGWNKLISKSQNAYNAECVYFANSYYLPYNANCSYTQYYVNYGDVLMSAIINYKNFYGCQFHPEKSGSVGSRILFDFIDN